MEPDRNRSFDVDGYDDEDFDPLAVADTEIDQEDMEDENPYDTVDYPTMREMPEHMHTKDVFTPDRQGGAKNAILELIDHNPARHTVYLGIIDACRGGCLSSEVTKRVEELQKDNRSVYAPMTLCRTLERAGALTLEMPQIAEEHEDIEEGVEYLEITERVDPIWHSTDEALEVYDQLTQGSEFRDIVFNQDRTYLEVYAGVMDAIVEEPRSKAYIDELTDTYPIVKHPRRFGGHFIDMLERTDAIEWKDRAWQMTDLGRALLPEVHKELEADRAATQSKEA